MGVEVCMISYVQYKWVFATFLQASAPTASRHAGAGMMKVMPLSVKHIFSGRRKV